VHDAVSRRALLGGAAAATALRLTPGIAAGQPGTGGVSPGSELTPPTVPVPARPAPLWSRRAAQRGTATTATQPTGLTTVSVPTVDSSVPLTFGSYDFVLGASDARPYAVSTPSPVEGWGVVDATGVRMVSVGGRLQDHPVAQAEYGIALLESYLVSKDSRHLDLAKKQAQRLIDRVVWYQRAWFYPYGFRYRVHARYDLFEPPWFSQLAQGLALTLFSRLAQVTGDITYRRAADYTMRSFLVTARAGSPWGTYVVGGRLWFDEYPNPGVVRGDRTYNGHMFASWGLWDYWSLTGSAEAKALLLGGLTTYLQMNPLVRHEGWQSRYCLAHGNDAGYYHSVHMGQLVMTYALTGAWAFARAADLLYGDYPLRDAGGTVRLVAGSHAGYRFGSTGQILATRTITPSALTSAPSSGRDKVPGRRETWYSVTAGSLAGYRVAETAGQVYQLGEYATLGYYLDRPARVLTPTPKAYRMAPDGTMAATTTDYVAGSAATIDRRAFLNGREHLRLGDGPYAGQWVGASAVEILR
jgi:hypothetical protein